MQNENIIVDIKISMNKGKWEILTEMDKESDINVLIELCYDWLEDCLTYLINPNTIKKLFEGKNNDFHKEIQINIESPEQFTKNDRRLLIEILRNSLRLNEFETLILIANFAAHIYPTKEDPKLKHEYNLMLEKLATYLIGYNIDIFIDNSVKLDRVVEDLVDKLTDILMFFIITIIYDSSIEEKVNKNINPPRNDSLQSLDDLNLKSNLHLKHLDNRLEQQSNPNIKLMRSNENSFLEIRNNPTNKKELEKDLILFEMFKSLEQYFKNKSSFITQSNKDKISSFNSPQNKNSLCENTTNFKEFDEQIINDIYNNFNKLLENKTNDSSLNYKEKFSLNSNTNNLANKMIKIRENSESIEIIEMNDSESLSINNNNQITPENKQIKHRVSSKRIIKEIDEENIYPSLTGTDIIKSNNIVEKDIVEISLKKIKSFDSFKPSDNSQIPYSEGSNKSKSSLQESKNNSDKNDTEIYNYIRPKSRNRTNSNFQLRITARESTMKVGEFHEYLSHNNENKVQEINEMPKKLVLKDDPSQDL